LMGEVIFLVGIDEEGKSSTPKNTRSIGERLTC
jgi:hypothetical protein